jgi:hypothetical protein
MISRRSPSLSAILGLALSTAALGAQQRFDLAVKEHVPVLQAGVADLVAADFDGDRRPDLLIAGQVRSLWLAAGGLRYRRGDALLPPRNGLRDRDLAAGDLDGDGDLDFVVARYGRDSEVWRNDGLAGFVDVTATALPRQPLDQLGRRVGLADLDGDGDLDLVLGVEGPDDLLYFNDGTGRLAPDPQRPLPPVRGTSGLVLADFDGDGDVDLLRTADAAGGDAPRLDLNDGTGRMATQPGGVLSSDRDQEEVIASDLDRDGDLDVLVRTRARGLLRWQNDGAGHLVEVPSRMPTDLPVPADLVVFDRDRDGDDDLLIASLGGARLLRNDGGSFVDFPNVDLPGAGMWTYRAAAVDVDGDADLDLFVAAGALALWVHEGDHEVDALELGLADVRGAGVLADLDGDGAPDLVSAPGHLSTRGPQVMLNDGYGRFVDGSGFPAAPAGTIWTDGGLAVGDVDGDGDPDVVIGQTDRPNRLYLNDGSGRFVEWATGLPQVTESTASLDLADVDGDGDLDLAVGVFSNGGVGSAPCRLLLNDGRGGFTDAPVGSIPRLFDLVEEARFADLDGDGDQDLMFASLDRMIGTGRRVWRNDGAGRFAEVPAAIPDAPGYATGLAFGDFDADGDLDLASGFALFENDGTGRFTDVTAALCGLPPGVGPVFVDLDEDGDLDLLSYRAALVQDATGRFESVPELFGPRSFGGQPPRPYAVGDVDHDGDVDVVGSYALYRNLTRQLAMPLLPQVGGLARFELRAASAVAPQVGLVMLAAERLAQPISLPGFGAFGLDPAWLIDSVPALVPAGGVAGRLAIAVPADPNLAGAVLHAQGLLLGDGGIAGWRLTGVSSERLVR